METISMSFKPGQLPRHSGGPAIRLSRKATQWERANLSRLNALAKHFNAFGFYGECSEVQARWCRDAVIWNATT